VITRDHAKKLAVVHCIRRHKIQYSVFENTPTRPIEPLLDGSKAPINHRFIQYVPVPENAIIKPVATNRSEPKRSEEPCPAEKCNQ